MMIIEDDAYDKNKPFVLFENLLQKGTLVVTAPADGYDIENAISGTTWDFYRPAAIVQFTSYAVDMGVDTYADCAFIDAHNLGTSESIVRVQHSQDGVDWTSVTTAFTPVDDAAIMVIFKPLKARFWRFALDNSVAPDVGVFSIGSRLVFPNGVDPSHTSIPHARKYELLGGDSINGQFTGQMVTRKSADLSVTFPLLDAHWVNTEMAAFERHYNEGRPFAWAASPSFDGDDMGFCQRPMGAGELRPRYYEGGMYEEFTMSLGVYVNV